MAARLNKWFVYHVVVDGVVIYVGKGCGRRHRVSAARLGGIPEIVQRFKSESDALRYEKRLIAEYKPQMNKTIGGEGRSKKRASRDTSGYWLRKWADEAYERAKSGKLLDLLFAAAYRKCELNQAKAA